MHGPKYNQTKCGVAGLQDLDVSKKVVHESRAKSRKDLT